MMHDVNLTDYQTCGRNNCGYYIWYMMTCTFFIIYLFFLGFSIGAKGIFTIRPVMDKAVYSIQFLSKALPGSYSINHQ